MFENTERILRKLISVEINMSIVMLVDKLLRKKNHVLETNSVCAIIVSYLPANDVIKRNTNVDLN